MDAVGHVNNATYFTFCESGRIEYFEQINVGRFTDTTEGPALVQATLNFRRQVTYPAVLDVGVRVPEMRTRSFRMDYAIFFEATDTLVADGTSVVAWADYRAGRSVDVPANVRDRIEILEGRKTIS
jgi:acyl-CoA thioester hydrolase